MGNQEKELPALQSRIPLDAAASLVYARSTGSRRFAPMARAPIADLVVKVSDLGRIVEEIRQVYERRGEG